MTGRYDQPVAEYARAVQDPVLRTCLEWLFLPEVPVYFLFLLMGALAGGQLGLIEGGVLDFVSWIHEDLNLILIVYPGDDYNACQ